MKFRCIDFGRIALARYSSSVCNTQTAAARSKVQMQNDSRKWNFLISKLLNWEQCTRFIGICIWNWLRSMFLRSITHSRMFCALSNCCCHRHHHDSCRHRQRRCYLLSFNSLCARVRVKTSTIFLLRNVSQQQQKANDKLFWANCEWQKMISLTLRLCHIGSDWVRYHDDYYDYGVSYLFRPFALP